jgi:hypothetical protein
MLFLYREQDIRFFGLCHDPGSDDAFPNLGKSNFDSGIDIGPCLVFYSSSSVSYHEKKARVVKIPAYRATLLLIGCRTLIMTQMANLVSEYLRQTACRHRFHQALAG